MSPILGSPSVPMSTPSFLVEVATRPPNALALDFRSFVLSLFDINPDV